MVLKEYLEEKRLTYREFAQRLGIRAESLKNIACLKKRPSLDLALKIEEITGITPKELIASFNQPQKKPKRRKYISKKIN